MTTRDMTIAEHTNTALTFLRQSEQEFAAGDIIQGSEKLWGSASHAVLALAKQRGWPTGTHRDMVHAARGVALEREEPSFEMGFAVARKFHSNFYGHGVFDPFSETEAMEHEREMVARFVHRALAIADEQP